MKKKIKNILLYLLLLISCMLIFAPIWIRNIFGDVTFDEIIFHMMVPLNGSNTSSYVISGLLNILLPSLVLSSILMIILTYKYKYTLQLEFKVMKKEFTIKAPKHLKIITYILFFIISPNPRA